MGAVLVVVQQRLGHHWRALLAAGVLLGLGFGLCLATFAAARRTDSAYERILRAADAPDAAVAISGPPDEAGRALRGVEGITAQRVYVGFIGTAEGVDPVVTTALLAPVEDRFPLERPTMRAGRLPNPAAPDEAFMSASAAARDELEVGDRLHFRFENPLTSDVGESIVTIVGIGVLPVEAVADETTIRGPVVFSRAFYETHRRLAVYAASNVDLAPGVDARRDLAPAVGELGHQLQSARSQEQQVVDQALRPLIIVLIAFGALLFAVSALVGGQVIHRIRSRWLADDVRLRTLGMTRRQILAVELATSSVVALLAVAVAVLTMVLLSPLAPIGPLHDLDPAQGVALDAMIAIAGTAAIIGTTLLLTVGSSPLRKVALRPGYRRASRIVAGPPGPAALAGLTLAVRPGNSRNRAWRDISAAVAATAVVALVLTFVTSAIQLTDTPARYGFDADLLALNAYGDQSMTALEEAFGERDDVTAATAFTAGSFLVDGRAVPGLAATTVKGDLTPTLLRGRPGLTDEEIVLGDDTLKSIDAALGDLVTVQILTGTGPDSERADQQARLRVVGVATFPPVNQVGTDMPRLGIGALVTREAFLRMQGDPANDPEFTIVRLAEGVDPAAVIADLPGGFEDTAQSTTTWFTNTKPAELRQLDAAMPYLNGARVAAYAILLAVVVHAFWVRARAGRRDLAVLRAIGFTRRQLDAVVGWQAAPFALGALLVGIPLGIVAGRRVYMLFAQSLAVVDHAVVSVPLVMALAVAVLLAVAIGGGVALAFDRRIGTASTLREM